MKFKPLYFVLLFLLITGIQGCRLFYPQQMFRTGDYPVSDIDSTGYNPEYRISPNDEFLLTVYTNSGEKLIDPVGAYINNSKQNSGNFVVQYDSLVRLPILGWTFIAGLTVREAETMLETKYSAFFKDPYVQLRITNRRVIVFTGGEGGAAEVIALTNDNTTLLEAIALAGGITDGKAYRIKLIRGNPSNPTLYEFDLSQVEGMKYGGIVVQANDVIYIEPRKRYVQKIAQGIMPYLTLTSTILLIYSIFK